MPNQGFSQPAPAVALVLDWCSRFESSSQFDRLDEAQQLLSEDIISFFCEYMASGRAPLPEQWKPDLVEEVLIYGFPAHIAADESYFNAVRPVLCQFVQFLNADRHLSEKHSASLQERIAGADAQMLRNAFDSSCWGLAKSMVMKAWEAGIDPGDDNAMSNFFEQNIEENGSHNYHS